ncbi:S8 family serine peptidase [Fimbriiglobus ruber]|uniref:Serine protease, subtilase family n=1 Tax=Fimbriiglobus ruber TaxID=1908690 RepID=A0A225DYW8_9BACT|nr:S8 family serine peptidase [Fimbriiglobus ruber]OWK43728.1 serine protease, subtilase family [Fimbriiglobus ruber]
MPAPSRDSIRALLGMETLEDRLTPTTTTTPIYDPTRVLVTFANTGTDAANEAELAASPLASGVAPLGFGEYSVNLVSGTTVTAAAPVFATMPGVVAAGPDYEVSVSAVPNDPSYSLQWALNNPTSGISAPAAWNVTTGTGKTIVAVIDTGVDYTDPDLAPNMWRNPNAGTDGSGLGYDLYGADFADNTGDPMDDDGHGTNVAGILGAAGNNGIGVAGVDWNVQIMALKFMGSDGTGYTSNAVRAMDFAVSHGAKIINESWGGATGDPTLAAAIARAQAAGVIVVTAAGNGGTNNDTTGFYPADYIAQSNNVVTVAATDSNNNLASFSNYGANTVMLAAPGVNILSTLPGNTYGYMTGTSMATPFVSGALALLWDDHPTWSYEQVIAKLKASVDPLPSLAGKTITGGRLDVAKLLDAPVSPPPVVAPPVVPPPAPPVVSPPVVPPPAPPVVSPPVVPPAVPPVTSQSGPRVLNAVVGGPQTGVFDRAWIQFNEPINPATITSSTVGLIGPGGWVGASTAVPVAGTNNTQFTVIFARNQSAPGAYTLSVGPNVRDTSGNAMNQNGNGTNGEAGDVYTLAATLGVASVPPVVSPPVSPPPPVVVPPTVPPAPTQTYSSATPLAINPLRTTRIDFAVNSDFTVSDLTVRLNITFGRTWDLNIRIVAPNGQSVTLFNRRGGDGANLTNTLFTDSAGTAIGSGSAPFVGSFQPEQALSLFNGMDARGLWSVQVFSLVNDGLTGTVNSVTLGFGGTTSTASLPSVRTAAAAQLTTLTAPDLRGATADVKAAVFDGRGDEPAKVPVSAPPLPPEVPAGPPTPTPPTTFRQSLPTRAGTLADLIRDFAPLRV